MNSAHIKKTSLNLGERWDNPYVQYCTCINGGYFGDILYPADHICFVGK